MPSSPPRPGPDRPASRLAAPAGLVCVSLLVLPLILSSPAGSSPADRAPAESSPAEWSPADRAPGAAGRWSAAGHMIVCDIGWRRLTPEARALVTDLIPGEDGRAFAESCVWADQVRGTTHAHTAAYHYINIPAGVAGVDLERDCGDPDRRCVTWAIPHYARVLADRGAGRTARYEALKFLGHFVGDLHQPLHAGRPEDLGGNRIHVDFFGETGTEARPLLLHTIWDRHIPARGGIVWPQSAALLEAAITPGEAAEWADFDVVGWTDESYRLAEEYVYGRLPADARIRNAYFRPAVGFAEVRMQQAGVRLAHLLHHAATNTLAFPEALTAAR